VATDHGAGARRVTLLTDFGTADGYVAAMKGAIAGIAASVIIDDASHDLPPGDIAAAAWSLAGYWDVYPPGTIHVVVVDPGVGTHRNALAIRIDNRFLVGPDNGVFTHVMAGTAAWDAVRLTERRYARGAVSATFHGRDIFAPAAAHLANGVALQELGPPLETRPVSLALDPARREGREVHGAVVHVDRFGNLITNIPAAWAPPGSRVTIAGRTMRVLRTYGDVEPGQLLALEGSRGVIEVAARDARACDALGAGVGERVRGNG
jgi:S-adenosyl-L-methionine hydrolase (adenosine-forming)